MCSKSEQQTEMYRASCKERERQKYQERESERERILLIFYNTFTTAPHKRAFDVVKQIKYSFLLLFLFVYIFCLLINYKTVNFIYKFVIAGRTVSTVK